MSTSLDAVADLATNALDRLQNTSELHYDQGISLLSARNDLFLSYLQHLLLVLAIQLQPATALKDHEDVVLELVKGRVTLEKVKPLQAKLKYQIEKLLSKAQEADSGVAANDDDIANGTSRPCALTCLRPADPLSFRPNPEALISSRAQDGRVSDSGGSEDEDERAAPADGIYRPPRVAATPYIEPSKKGKRPQQVSRAVAELVTAVNDRTPYAEGSS
jgi:U3 small nucleolar ribonucleoprotein protein LCP5